MSKFITNSLSTCPRICSLFALLSHVSRIHIYLQSACPRKVFSRISESGKEGEKDCEAALYKEGRFHFTICRFVECLRDAESSTPRLRRLFSFSADASLGTGFPLPPTRIFVDCRCSLPLRYITLLWPQKI